MVTATTYEIIKECQKNGALKKLYDKGVISYKPIADTEIYEKLLEEIDQNKHLRSCVTQAVHNTAVFFSISEGSVWKLKKSMES